MIKLAIVMLTAGLYVSAIGSSTWAAGSSSSSASSPASTSTKALIPTVELEQEVYTYTFAQNGSTPMWCYGNTCIVRTEGGVFASGVRTLPDYKPLNNVRWMLLQGGAGGWKELANGGDTHEREPCPLICLGEGRILLSTNPNSCKPDQSDGPAQPQVLQFDASASQPAYKTLTPKWNKDLAFHAHTYRSFVADGPRQEFVLFYSIAYDKTYWTFYDKSGAWASQGEIAFPVGAEYDKPQPLRICYPVVQLKDRAVHYCGVSDILEPYKAWKDYKKQLTGKEWDYAFRRLYYTWSDDIVAGKFHNWIELANVDKTGGSLVPCDLWVGPDGRVHILWFEQAIDERLRKEFFPDAKQSRSLNYAVLRDGQVLMRKSIQKWDEGAKGPDVSRGGRFHVTPDQRLLVVYYAGGRNRLVEINKDGSLGQSVALPLKKPLSSFFVAGPRGGSAPSMTIDMLGDADNTLRYVSIRLR